MNDFNQKLKDTFQVISKKAYEHLEVTDEPIRQVHEDGISSIILKKIAKLKNEGLFIKTKSLEVHENVTGMDFDLWIGENDNKYIRFHIQAKSFKNNTKTTDSYNFDLSQCNKLLRHCQEKHEAFPLYFLYQYIADRDLKKNHFSFINDFKHEYSSITFASAKNVQALIKSKETRFCDIHENDIEKRWKNEIYDLFEEKDIKIGLPLYLLYDISPSKVEKFQKLIGNKFNTLGYFYYFYFGEYFPFKIHKISATEIEKLYGKNKVESDVQFKNLVIINDNMKLQRDRKQTLNKLLK